MRLLKLGVYYSTYLDNFYRVNASMASAPYAVQHSALMDDCFGSSDFWTTALACQGYETCEIVANARPLQQGWATENGLKFNDDTWLFDISVAQVVAFRPDVIIVADYSTFTEAYVRRLRDVCPSIVLVLGWCGAPYNDPSVFRAWDIVLSCVPELVKGFRAKGHSSQHLHHSFDPRVREKVTLAHRSQCDFSFVGSIFKADQFHMGRDLIVSYLLERTELELWSEAASSYGLAGDFAAGRLNRLHGAVFGRAMYQRIADSRVSLNTHIDIAARSASNMRLFEATGVGTCLLTDWKPNLGELFEIDREVVSYRTPEECAEKVRYLLDNEQERYSIAERGCRRTLKDHCVNVRVERLDEIIKSALDKPVSRH